MAAFSRVQLRLPLVVRVLILDAMVPWFVVGFSFAMATAADGARQGGGGHHGGGHPSASRAARVPAQHPHVPKMPSHQKYVPPKLPPPQKVAQTHEPQKHAQPNHALPQQLAQEETRRKPAAQNKPLANAGSLKHTSTKDWAQGPTLHKRPSLPPVSAQRRSIHLLSAVKPLPPAKPRSKSIAGVSNKSARELDDDAVHGRRKHERWRRVWWESNAWWHHCWWHHYYDWYDGDWYWYAADPDFDDAGARRTAAVCAIQAQIAVAEEALADAVARRDLAEGDLEALGDRIIAARAAIDEAVAVQVRQQRGHARNRGPPGWPTRS